MRAEAVVIGGGVIGLATAHHLSRRGVDVTVLERRRLGAGASSGNAGWLVPALSGPVAAPGMIGHSIRELVRRDGALRVRPRAMLTALPWLLRFARHCNPADHLSGLRATAALAEQGLDAYDELADAGVEFTMSASGLISAYLSLAAARRGAQDLVPLHDFGYDEPTVLDARAVHDVEPALSDAVLAGYLLTGERVVDPHTLIAGLEKDLRNRGVRILEDWAVTGFAVAGDRVTAVVGPRGSVLTERVVISAGVWSDHLLEELGARAWLQAGKGYSLKGQPAIRIRRPVLFAEAKSGATPLRDGVRVVGHLDLNGLRERPSPARLRALNRVAARYLRDWPVETEEPWCGLRSVTPDGLPVISRLPSFDNVTVGVGHGLLGVTLAVATATLLTQLSLGDPVPAYADPFRIDRFDRRGRSHAHARTQGNVLLAPNPEEL